MGETVGETSDERNTGRRALRNKVRSEAWRGEGS